MWHPLIATDSGTHGPLPLCELLLLLQSVEGRSPAGPFWVLSILCHSLQGLCGIVSMVSMLSTVFYCALLRALYTVTASLESLK